MTNQSQETFTFGKYNGERITDVVVQHPGYVFTLLQKTEEKYKETENFFNLLDHFINGEQVLPFGKFKGQVINEVDKGYLEWLLNKFSKQKEEPGWLAYKISYLLGKDVFEF